MLMTKKGRITYHQATINWNVNFRARCNRKEPTVESARNELKEVLDEVEGE